MTAIHENDGHDDKKGQWKPNIKLHYLLKR